MRHSNLLRALLLLACVPGFASAQTIYKCVVKGEPTSYQNAPCSPDARIASIREFQAEAAPAYDQPRQRQRRETQARQESAYLSRLAGTDGKSRAARGHVLPSGGAGCEKAKRDRDAWEQRVGLSRSYESLSAWNERVRRACK